jgi:hypothetical protein
MSRELSVFIDESGDFGEYDFHSPFYIITRQGDGSFVWNEKGDCLF